MSRVLVAEDDTRLREAIHLILSEEGYEVRMVANGREALMALDEFPADVIVTDLLMPEKDGIELIFELRRAGSKAKIVAVSGGRRILPHIEQILDSLCDVTFVEKPFRRATLLSAIKGKPEVHRSEDVLYGKE